MENWYRVFAYRFNGDEEEYDRFDDLDDAVAYSKQLKDTHNEFVYVDIVEMGVLYNSVTRIDIVKSF